MLETIKKDWRAKGTLLFFILFTCWWIYLQVGAPSDQTYHKLFGALYGFIAIGGGLSGLIISSKWGGIKSIMGKAIIMFSLGLLAQEFGQLAYSYNDYVLHKPGLYPSTGDIGYFGSIPLYTYGIILLGSAAGVPFRLRSFTHKLQAIIIPVVILCIGYFLFLQGYKFDWSHPLTIFLDFGYPLGEAIYISLTIVTLLLSRGILGGIMKSKILFVLFALCIQFLSDYTFLYQNSKNIWKVGQINDFMYFLAYTIMTLAILQFYTVLHKLKTNK